MQGYFLLIYYLIGSERHILYSTVTEIVKFKGNICIYYHFYAWEVIISGVKRHKHYFLFAIRAHNLIHFLYYYASLFLNIRP